MHIKLKDVARYIEKQDNEWQALESWCFFSETFKAEVDSERSVSLFGLDCNFFVGGCHVLTSPVSLKGFPFLNRGARLSVHACLLRKRQFVILCAWYSRV